MQDFMLRKNRFSRNIIDDILTSILAHAKDSKVIDKFYIKKNSKIKFPF